MANRGKGPVRHLVVASIATVAALAAGCASEPPAPPTAESSPAPGDSLEDIARRGYVFVPVYEFVDSGRRYALANAVSAYTSYDLVFIDSRLACTAQQGLDRELFEWQWVGEPEGLTYLAGRLRQACGLEPPTPPRTTYAAEPADPMKVPVVSTGPSPGEETFGEALLGGLVGGVLLTVALVWGPLLWIPAGIYSAVTEPPEDVAAAVGPVAHDSRALLLRVPMPADEVAAKLGAPHVSFTLPEVGTEVQQYRVEKKPLLYVGVVDGQVVWIHGPDPWLKERAKQVMAEQKPKQ